MLSSVCGFNKISPAPNQKRHKFCCELEDMVDSLRDKVGQLRSKKRRIEARLKLEESAYKKPTHKVTEWLYKADSIGAEGDRAIVEAALELAERRTLCCCPWNWRSSCIVGSSVYEKLEVANQLLTVDEFDVVVQRMPHHHVDVIPVEPTVHFESNLDDVWRCLEDERLQIIGIFGMAGVGKTTLLKKIKDDLEKRRAETPAVIWLSASKETRLDAFQKDIAKQSAVFHKRWRRAFKPADGTRKFVVLIDDLWTRLDLSKIVVPRLKQSGYKVVFTTRSEVVCDDMAVDAKLKLNCLSDDEARKLFRMYVGDYKLNLFPEAQHLCQGLPLALVEVGLAMAQMRNPSLDELYSMKRVFHILQPSYDNLDDDKVRQLFLYCSILPGKIRKDELIRLWMGEGFVDFSDKRRGEYVVKKLEQTCLLERDEINNSVGMHSVIQALGLYLCSEHALLQEGKSAKVNEAVRISMEGGIDTATLQRLWPQLQTLFIRINNLTTFPEEFFNSMRSLKVLDLSNNDMLVKLPPSIGILGNLHYLNLSWTSITDVLVEVISLIELKVLLADYTKNWKRIGIGMIRSLISLKVFSNVGGAIRDDVMLLEELESTEGMHEIGVSLFSHRAVEKLLDSPKLQNCIQKLTLNNVWGPSIPVSSLSSMAQLETLVIEDCFDLLFETDGSHYHVLNIQGL